MKFPKELQGIVVKKEIRRVQMDWEDSTRLENFHPYAPLKY
jgi:hypothetical protein